MPLSLFLYMILIYASNILLCSTAHELYTTTFQLFIFLIPSNSIPLIINPAPSLILPISIYQIYIYYYHHPPLHKPDLLMALETWFTKMKSAISTSIDSVRSTMSQEALIAHIRKCNVGILAFEFSSLMSKLVHLWRSLSDPQIVKLHHETIALEGIRKVVSDDDTFLLGLACAEFTEILRLVADAVSNLSKRCTDQGLRQFDQAFKDYVGFGVDPNRWVMSWKEMDSKVKKMDRYIASTASLYKEMDELSEAEHGLKKLLQSNQYLKLSKFTDVADVQQKIFWQRQEINYLKQGSLWGCSFDSAISLLARSSFTILARVKHAFGISHQEINPPIPRSLSVSAAVYPSSPLKNMSSWLSTKNCGLFELSSTSIVPPPTTLGAAALALHYANVIIIIEKMIRNPKSVGSDARDDLYSMLPKSVRGLLRSRLRGVGWGVARDAGLAAEWRDALDRIIEWLGPIAHNTIRWQGERSFERRSAVAPKANVLVLQTLYFANREKVEAAMAELLVGFNYVWRFEMERIKL